MPADHLASEILDDASFASSSLLPPRDVTEASVIASTEVEPVAVAPVPAATSGRQEAPSATQRRMAGSSQTHAQPPPTPVPQPQQQQNAPAAVMPPPGEDTLCVSEQCSATKCFRLQWEAEINPRCTEKTTFQIQNAVYLFDGFYILCHGSQALPSVPQFEYTRGSVMCKIQFIPEELPSPLRTVKQGEHSFCESLFLLQRYLFNTLMGILPFHLFSKVFSNPEKATGDPSDFCSDYHLIPRFIAVNETPLLHKEDLHAPQRVGFAIGQLLSVPAILDFLEQSVKFTVADYLRQLPPNKLQDSIVTTRINGQPGAFRVDELIWSTAPASGDPSSAANGNAKASSSNAPMSREVKELRHHAEGAIHYDGAKSKKRVRKWQALGEFLQLSHQIAPKNESLNINECHLTGLRTDIFELGSVMPMVLKHIRHCNLLTSFEQSMGLKFQDKALLRQAFTHGSYVDVGMQNVNTFEGTFARVRLAHVFNNASALKRSRYMLYEEQNRAAEMDHDMKRIADTHLGSDFKEEFHSRFLCPYERLEFLGDAVLSFLVASSTFLKFADADEGFLHQTRVDIVNNNSLGQIARAANFESLLLSAFDLTKLNEDTKSKIVADCFEALLGAIYKDQGIEPCRRIFGKLVSNFDQELKDLIFMTTQEMNEKMAEFIDVDRERVQEWSKYAATRLVHRRFTSKTEVPIKNMHLWLQCMTHGSFKAPQIDADEFVCTDPSYERIEFLGDAVLQLLSSAFLVDAFPYHQEHLLTQARSSLVKNTRLAVVARTAGYEEYLRIGNEAKKTGNLYVEDVLADVFEATLGAVFLENVGDLTCVKRILEKKLFPLLKEAIRKREWMTPRKVLAHYMSQWNAGKTRQEQLSFKKIPNPNGAGADDHCVALFVGNFRVASAMGRTIVAAQDAACKRALKLYGLKMHE